MSEQSDVAKFLAEAGAALQRRDSRAALELIAQAEAHAPADANIKMQKALAHRVGGAFAQALDALDEALALDPYNFLALLSKGAVVEIVARLPRPFFISAVVIRVSRSMARCPDATTSKSSGRFCVVSYSNSVKPARRTRARWLWR